MQKTGWTERQGLTERVRTETEAYLSGLPRLQRLCDYARGRHDILARSRKEGLPNNRLAHGFPRVIAEMGAGYMLGERTEYRAEDEGAQAAFLALIADSEADSLDMDLALNQAVYGHALSLSYESGGGRMRTCSLDPKSAFLIRDRTVEARPLAGVVLSAVRDPDGRQTGLRADVWTDEACLRCEGRDARSLRLARAPRPHPFGLVPVVEYRNNSERQGDFESVLPLVDAYDLLGSDRMNDRGQFADAMLVLTGVMGLGVSESGEDGRQVRQRLRQERTLTLPDSDARAEWLVKDPQEKDIDVLRQALAGDIHKFSMTPDLDDDRFSGNISGVAIRYKLFCMDQKTRIKERWFLQGLRERAALYCRYLNFLGRPFPDPERLQIRLKRPAYEG